MEKIYQKLLFLIYTLVKKFPGHKKVAKEAHRITSENLKYQYGDSETVQLQANMHNLTYYKESLIMHQTDKWRFEIGLLFAPNAMQAIRTH